MPRFYVPQPQIAKEMLTIGGGEARHIRRVFRLKAGDEIIIFDGSGREYEGTIIEEKTSSVVVTIRDIRSSERESPLKITLAQSLLKGEKMDYLIQKATELGVTEIVPFLSTRAVPLLGKSEGLKRIRRWKRIATEASKQCGRGIIPKIESLYEYPEALKTASTDSLRLLLWEEEGTRLREILSESKEKMSVFFIVGPEGGFSRKEVEDARKVGFISVTLGERILRSETASLCLLSILQYERGDI